MSNFLTDALGSPVAVANGAGEIQTEYNYAAFGTTTVTGTFVSNPFQYTGRENDGTGLYYYRARYYHPTFQRFLSEDPTVRTTDNMCASARFNFIQDPIRIFGPGDYLDLNLYAYVTNNPIKFIDPEGMQAVIPRPGSCIMLDCNPCERRLKDGCVLMQDYLEGIGYDGLQIQRVCIYQCKPKSYEDAFKRIIKKCTCAEPA